MWRHTVTGVAVDEHAEALTLDAYIVEWPERRNSQLRPTTLKSCRQAVDSWWLAKYVPLHFSDTVGLQ